MLSRLLIDKTKPGSKTIRLWDGRGMYLEISPKGGKWWRLKYWFGGRERRMSLGIYPDVGLADARENREEARRKVAAGIDPGEQRKAAKVALVEGTENTFEAIAREWFAMFSKPWAPSHANKIIRGLSWSIFDAGLQGWRDSLADWRVELETLDDGKLTPRGRFSVGTLKGDLKTVSVTEK